MDIILGVRKPLTESTNPINWRNLVKGDLIFYCPGNMCFIRKFEEIRENGGIRFSDGGWDRTSLQYFLLTQENINREITSLHKVNIPEELRYILETIKLP